LLTDARELKNASALPPSRGKLRRRMLGPQDIPAILLLRDEVLSQLETPDLYVREADEATFVRAHCGPRGETIGLFQADRLIAYAMLGLPLADDPDNLGRVLGLNRTLRARVAHLASCMVHETWRSRHLQQSLLKARYAMAREHGRTLCIGMASLLNNPSRHNMMSTGCTIEWVGELDALRRQLLVRNLAEAGSSAPGRSHPLARLIDSEDFSGQRALLQAGLHGIGEQANGTRIDLIFAPRQ